VIGEGLALWRGRALVELEGWSPGRIEATRLEELRLDAQEVLVEAALRAGRYREVLAEVQARVAEAPLRERRWALLAMAQYQAGRQGEALRTLHRARTVLASELGLEPGPDLVALEAAILRQDPSLVAEVALPEPSALPVPRPSGLRRRRRRGLLWAGRGRGRLRAPSGGGRGVGGSGAVG
jgi:Bacterial transcriptional activator domain